MKRLALTLILIVLAGGAWSAVRRLPHQASRLGPRDHGPRPERPERPAGERLEDDARGPAAGVGRHDPQRSGEPRRQALRLHQHRLHAARAAHRRSRDRERDRHVPDGAGVERAGVLARRQADLRVERRRLPAERHPVLRSLGQGRLEGQRARATRSIGAAKDKTAVSSLNVVSRRQAALRAQQLRRSSLHPRNARRPRGRAAEGRRPSDVGESSRRTARRCTSRTSASANVAIVDVSDPEPARPSPARSRPIRIRTTSRSRRTAGCSCRAATPTTSSRSI